MFELVDMGLVKLKRWRADDLKARATGGAWVYGGAWVFGGAWVYGGVGHRP